MSLERARIAGQARCASDGSTSPASIHPRAFGSRHDRRAIVLVSTWAYAWRVGSDDGEQAPNGSSEERESGLSRKAKATIATLTALVGLATGVLTLRDQLFRSDESDGGSESSAQKSAANGGPAVPESRLVSARRIGFYSVEVDGSSGGATDALGQPTTTERDATTCTMTWKEQGLIMKFGNFGGADPCLYGSFCTAQVGGRDWSTAKGLQPGMPTRRMLQLYPNAERVEEPGEIVRYVLDPGIELCGRDAEGGLEAWTNVGRVFSLRVSFQAGGD